MWKWRAGFALSALIVSGCGPEENIWGDDEVVCEGGLVTSGGTERPSPRSVPSASMVLAP